MAMLRSISGFRRLNEQRAKRDLPVPDLSKSELCGRQREDWKPKTEGRSRLMPFNFVPCPDVIDLFLRFSMRFALGYLHLATSMVMSSCCS